MPVSDIQGTAADSRFHCSRYFFNVFSQMPDIFLKMISRDVLKSTAFFANLPINFLYISFVSAPEKSKTSSMETSLVARVLG